MKVFKFGGASVKDAESVRNVAHILAKYKTNPVTVVISAMGKTTNAMESLYRAYIAKESTVEIWEEIKKFHLDLVHELGLNQQREAIADLESLMAEVAQHLIKGVNPNHDYVYDQLVAYGELMSTTIVSNYLTSMGIQNQWFDARALIKTDYRYRDAKIEWSRTKRQVDDQLGNYFSSGGKLAVTQGFIAGGDSLHTTTLGREGSDYSAAILANVLDAGEVVIWKDVDGVMNADPKYFENVQMLESISYKEAIELAYYGASVIHPKTVQPLQQKGIPLKVKSFIDPTKKGSVISSDKSQDGKIPSYISKRNQRLISIKTKDYSFVVEEHLSDIFNLFAEHRVKMNMMQHSAINFSVATDESPFVEGLIEELQRTYNVLYNVNLELLTIRHFNEDIIEQLTAGKVKLMEQKTRYTYRVLLKSPKL